MAYQFSPGQNPPTSSDQAKTIPNPHPRLTGVTKLKGATRLTGAMLGGF